MKRTLIAILKVGVPLAIGIWLVFYFYDALDPGQRKELFVAFRQADLRWLGLATLVGWLSHVSRAWRWRYMLEPLGYKPGFWNCY
ncbi:MAG: flippase-like domain-containing protein, partial [Flavobacteriales bacterium]|nr:flippase-like domain-containing protein [Flavobacteriales bacterium]